MIAAAAAFDAVRQRMGRAVLFVGGAASDEEAARIGDRFSADDLAGRFSLAAAVVHSLVAASHAGGVVPVVVGAGEAIDLSAYVSIEGEQVQVQGVAARRTTHALARLSGASGREATAAFPAYACEDGLLTLLPPLGGTVQALPVLGPDVVVETPAHGATVGTLALVDALSSDVASVAAGLAVTVVVDGLVVSACAEEVLPGTIVLDTSTLSAAALAALGLVASGAKTATVRLLVPSWTRLPGHLLPALSGFVAALCLLSEGRAGAADAALSAMAGDIAPLMAPGFSSGAMPPQSASPEDAPS